MEGLQAVITMRADGKDVIHVSQLHLWLAWGHLQGSCHQASMKMLATMGRSGEPIAAPFTCSKKDLPNWK